MNFKKNIKHFSFLISFLYVGCSAPQIPPVEIKNQKEVDFLKDVKPVLDKRCVVCHSCYNSPCQAKFSSFEGIDRGGSKIKVYDATRLKSINPTRLFVDGNSTQEWRKKGFFSLTENKNDSIMLHLIYDKKKNPEIIGEYAPEDDELICPKDKKELEQYIDKKPYHGMPYGLPQLKDDEYHTLSSWLVNGAKPMDKKSERQLKTPSKEASLSIRKWEEFLNQPNPKYQVTARYLYEHLYLAHIYFPNAKGEFFKLIKSYTPYPKKPQIIPLLRPFDNPGVDKFYYRFEKIHSTIVHKTHITFNMGEDFYKRTQELFIKPKWVEKPHNIGYNPNISSNPFIAFKQIPIKSRYQFLLDNSHYIVMTFIRGPVCRGQMAVNVIHDHFWVMFRDPNYDISILDSKFIDKEVKNLEIPINSVNEDILKTFSDAYRVKYETYYKEKVQKEVEYFPNGYDYNSIWKGNKASDAPILSVYRHFDSASVHKGVLGSLPRTMWVIDYPQFERIYYTLVAGYDVFGNVSHQTNIRRYMDFLRIEGELNFLEYMPKSQRYSMLKSWYINDKSVDKAKYVFYNGVGDTIKYKTKKPKQEFIEHIVQKDILKTTGIDFDEINYKLQQKYKIELPKTYNSVKDYLIAAKAATMAGSGFVSYMTDKGANNIYLRIDMPDGSHIRKSLVINRWHDNVNSLFLEKHNLNPKKDTMDILDGSIGSYPNVFAVVKFKDLSDFLYLMTTCKGKGDSANHLKKFFISRSDKDFWKIHDWFLEDFYKKDPLNAGLYDLNRYARRPWNK